MSSYFSLPSFARAKQNKETLEKSNPQNPVLKEEDEQFLHKQIESDEAASKTEDAVPTKITESGEEEKGTSDDKRQAGAGADQVALPEVQPEPKEDAQKAETTSTAETRTSDDSQESKPMVEDDATAKAGNDEHDPKPAEAVTTTKDDTHKTEPETGDGSHESKPTGETEENAEDPPEIAPEDSAETVGSTATKEKKGKAKKSFDLPSQEEAEAATKSFDVGADKGERSEDQHGEKRTWASYLPTLGAKKGQTADGKDEAAADKSETGDQDGNAEKKSESVKQTDNTAESKEETVDKKSTDAPKDGEKDEQGEKRTWAGYASSAYSSLPSLPQMPQLPQIPSIPALRSNKGKDSKAEPVYNEDGTINEEKTKEKQEREVSVLLDRLDLSSINNRVFAFSGETQNIYARFAEVLKDTMNGAPTAYDDMEKLMKDAGPQLEKQFAAMPPFVQTLVKSLPAKLGTSLGPELMAAVSEKPGGDLNARMAAASNKSGGEASMSTASTAEKSEEKGQKKKRKIPSLKALVSGEGAVASLLRNAVGFLRVRFPILASTTNVVMSLAVFILMFVFWYCHKRGREMRLEKAKALEAEGGEQGKVIGEEDAEMEVDATDEEAEDEGEDEKEGASTETAEPVAGKTDEKADASASGTSSIKKDDAAKTSDKAESAAKEVASTGGEADKAEPGAATETQSSETSMPDKKKGEVGTKSAKEKVAEATTA